MGMVMKDGVERRREEGGKQEVERGGEGRREGRRGEWNLLYHQEQLFRVRNLPIILGFDQEGARSPAVILIVFCTEVLAKEG